MPLMLRFAENIERQTSANEERAWLLCRGVRNLLRCDEAEVVGGIVRYVVSQHGILRFMLALIERTRRTPIPSLLALAAGLKSFLAVRSIERRDGALWIARLSNERRAIEPLLPLLPEISWNELKFRLLPDAGAIAALTRLRNFGSTVRRMYRLARRLHRRHEFFKVLRVVELIGYYARYLSIFRHGRFRLALMSSHSNPHGIAFNLAARKCCVPVALVTHGMPVRPVARLSYELAVVHCEAAQRTYIEEGCRMERVMAHGRRQDYATMPTVPLPESIAVGIFLCKDVHEQRLRAVVERLLGNARVSNVLVRPHPKNLWTGLDAWIASRNDSRLRRSSGVPVSRDIDATDIVLAGNSSVLIEAVTAGRPGGYVPGLDYGSTDMHAFVARGLIYRLDDELNFDPDAMLNFYHRPEWQSVLRFFANIAEDESSVAARAVDAMRELSLR